MNVISVHKLIFLCVSVCECVQHLNLVSLVSSRGPPVDPPLVENNLFI